MSRDDLAALARATEAMMAAERKKPGHCMGCGAKFLTGEDDDLCFWCADNEDYDPSDPKPSRYHYGNC
jgi:hypothetical protein